MKEGVESLGRVRAQAMVLLVIAFLAGAFVGGVMERVMVRPSRSGTGSMRGGPRGGRNWYESLGLSAEQRTKIEAILARRSQRVDSAMKSACVVIGPARDSSTKEIDAVLTAEQKAKRDSVRALRPPPRGETRVGPLGCPIGPREGATANR
jgi:Spy/CpxP family protein refolding chaperone